MDAVERHMQALAQKRADLRKPSDFEPNFTKAELAIDVDVFAMTTEEWDEYAAKVIQKTADMIAFRDNGFKQIA